MINGADDSGASVFESAYLIVSSKSPSVGYGEGIPSSRGCIIKSYLSNRL